MARPSWIPKKSIDMNCPHCSSDLMLVICGECLKPFPIDKNKPLGSQLPSPHTMVFLDDGEIVRHKTEEEMMEAD